VSESPIPSEAPPASTLRADIIDSLDLPILTVGRDCAISRFNSAAATLLSLTPADLGRPLPAIPMLRNVKRLEELCGDAIASQASSQCEVRDATNGSWFVLRIAPYIGSEQRIDGAVLTLQNVTAFRASLEQAIYEREYTKAIINTVIDPLVVLDVDCRVQAANQAFYTKFQVSRDQAHGARFYEIGSQDWETPRLQKFLKETDGNSQSDAEFEHELPAIGRRTVLLNARRLSQGSNVGDMTLLVIRDITEQKLAAKRLATQYGITRVLAESEGLLEGGPKLIRAVCEAADWEVGALWRVDKTAEKLRCLEFVNCSPKEVPGFEAATRSHTFSSGIGLPGRVWGSGEPAWIPDVAQDGNFPRAQAAVQDGLHGAFAFPVRAGNQILGVMEFFSDEVRQPEAQLIDLLTGFGNQIGQFAERKRAEAELRESERRFREMVDALPAPVYTTDAQGRITHFNPAAVDFAGRVPELGTDQWCVTWKLFRADGTPLPHDQCPMAVALKEGRIVDGVESIAERPDGKRFWCVPYPRLLRDAEGRILGGVNLLMDITERKQAELAIRQSEERLRRLSESLDADVRARTAELEERNREVLTRAEQVRELSWQVLRIQDEERRHIARELHDSAGQNLAVLGMNLATIAQKAKKRAPEMSESVDQAIEMVQELNKEIRTTSYLLHPPLLDENGLPAALSWYIRGLSERSGLDTAFSISEQFGRLPRDLELVIFRLVQECLTNIHRHSGSKTANIQIHRDSERILIEVRDQGKGIPRDRLAQIEYGISGVGIRGMRERLRQFQGEVILDSVGPGTTVVVTIPVRKDVHTDKIDARPFESAL